MPGRANAQHIVIALQQHDHIAELSVRDEGSGIPRTPGADTGSGLHIMQYRADVLGGSLGRRATDGTVVVCSFDP
jgi:nitrate/nitrite-specific signal transduction histidine kinase